MLRAYMACVIANVAFLELGQTRVREAGAIPHIIHLLRQKDKKVQLHATASVQNLTYKNDVNCRLVLEQDGERALNKLLRHKSEDIQQYAAGALSNLQLYQRSKGPDAPQPKQRSQPQQQQPAGWPYGEEERAMPHGSGGMGGVGSASATVSKGSTDGMLGANKCGAGARAGARGRRAGRDRRRRRPRAGGVRGGGASRARPRRCGACSHAPPPPRRPSLARAGTPTSA